MAIFAKLVSCLIVSTVVYVGILIYDFEQFLFKDEPVQVLNNTWWGPSLPNDEDTTIRPFTINVSDEILIDLQHRLKRVKTLVPPLDGIQQQYGVNSNLMKDIIEFWKTKYNWREREILLNKYPQFKTKIQGLDIHYIHVKPKPVAGKQILPILLLHGWPGSVKEFYEVIALLTTPRNDKDFLFEVIVPSLPGFGFSKGTSRPGLNIADMGVVLKNLMHRIGIKQFYIQGGDLGSMIGSNMAALFEEYVLGFHSNMCYSAHNKSLLKHMVLASIYPSAFVEKKYEHRTFYNQLPFYLLETAYLHYHATKPDTIGMGLSDSPMGLAAVILEKFSTVTNPEFQNRADGGLTIKYKYEDLLDNVMIYWITNSITTSIRVYAEYFNGKIFTNKLERIPVNVPTACVVFEHEIVYFPRCVLEDRFRQLIQSTHYDDIGHFAAFEAPQVLADDMFSAMEKMEYLHLQTINKL